MSQTKREAALESATDYVNVAVKSMGDQYASAGVVIETNADRCCPKLKPGEVIQVPIDHVIVDHPSTEITHLPPNRPVRYADAVEASLAGNPQDDARELEKMSMLQGAVDDRMKAMVQRQQAKAEAVAKGEPLESQAEMEKRIREEVQAKLAEKEAAGVNRKNQHTRANPRETE